MSDRIAVMDQGIVQQTGQPRDIYEHPTNRFVADFIGETNFLKGVVEQVDDIVRLGVGEGQIIGQSDLPLQVGQPAYLAIRPEKINLYPQGEIDVLRTEAGLNYEEINRLLGGNLPESLKMDTREWLGIEKDNMVLNGRIAEAIYIGTDTRYRVDLLGDQQLFVRSQNFGSRYDTTFAVGYEVLLHWAAENARVLTE